MSGRRSTRTIHSGRRALASTLALSFALIAAGPAQAEENAFAKRSSQAFDLIVVRPLGVGRILFGFVFFVPAAVFAEAPPVMGGDEETWQSAVGDVWDFFVMEPVRATFMTPLGEFEEDY